MGWNKRPVATSHCSVRVPCAHAALCVSTPHCQGCVPPSGRSRRPEKLASGLPSIHRGLSIPKLNSNWCRVLSFLGIKGRLIRLVPPIWVVVICAEFNKLPLLWTEYTLGSQQLNLCRNRLWDARSGFHVGLQGSYPLTEKFKLWLATTMSSQTV